MRLFLAVVASVLLASCSLIYKLPTRQGNVIQQEQLDKLKVGMTRDQVAYLLGTPIAASPFDLNRWDYLGYYKSPRGVVASRTVSLYFEADKLAKLEGAEPTTVTAKTNTPDAKAIIRQQKKDETEAERALSDPTSGVIITPPAPN